ncbi:ATP-binding protein [Embleya sp. NBC_00888]|uniref:ATP-binding protein n=1 Tax=Embleya sp. NBC_00888 TaxID=2975960 RepID=UPI00386C1177|nr:ATP-binding protein [Embleya sp. NBC_00888]
MPGSLCPAGEPAPAIPAVPAIPVIPSHWSFPADPTSVRRARRAVMGALPRGCRPELADELVLVTSELVTNALLYGTCPAHGCPIELVLWPADGYCWLAVSDPGTALPALASPGPRECGGRGLLLVSALTAAWAVVPRHGCGKSVVVGLRLAG